MCGICGILCLDDQQVTRKDTSRIERMVQEMHHRGPDARYCVNRSDIVLGHARLKIIDLSENARQPMSNEDDSIWVVFNGELYDYESQRKQLIEKGHKFKSASDTEIILHLYEEYGEACIGHLNGMFAVAIWDEREKKLLLSVDRLGIKPLYYTVNNNRVIFASELGAILSSSSHKWQLNYESLGIYFSFNYIAAPHTIVKEVYKVRPSEAILFERGGIKKKWNYWNIPAPNYRNKDISLLDIKSGIREKFNNAIRSHQVADVPLGAFLSGGIDSSAIVGMMNQTCGKQISTFTLGFEDPRLNSYDERSFARCIANHYHTDHHEIIVTPESIIETIPTVLDGLNEPFGDYSLIPAYLVSKNARMFMTVALSGDGGDELFGGYRKIALDSISQRLGPILGLVQGTKFIWKHLPERRRTRIERSLLTLKQFLSGASQDAVTRWMYWMNPYKNVDLSDLLSPDAFKLVRRGLDTAIGMISEAYSQNHFEHIDRILHLDMLLNLPGDMLTKVDIASMKNSLEVRVPFLDVDLVEYASQIPGRDKMGTWELKKLFRECVKDLIPPEILNRHKGGFTLPLGQWFKGELKSMVDDFVNKIPREGSKIFNKTCMRRIADEHAAGVRDHTMSLWNSLVLFHWLNRYSSMVE